MTWPCPSGAQAFPPEETLTGSGPWDFIPWWRTADRCFLDQANSVVDVL